MLETWDLFTMNDTLVAVVGAVGLTSVMMVFVTAMSNIEKRERRLRDAMLIKRAIKRNEQND